MRDSILMYIWTHNQHNEKVSYQLCSFKKLSSAYVIQVGLNNNTETTILSMEGALSHILLMSESYMHKSK
jgi:hypothetical protein